MKDDSVFVAHIMESINYIEKFSRDISKEEFSRNRLVRNAIVRELEIIGEASKNLSDDFKIKHKNIEWKPIVGFRDKLIHNYFGLDIERVWNVIEKDLSIFKKQLENL